MLKKVKDSPIKQELYEVFKKFVHKPENKKTVSPYNLDEILTRFNHKSPKEVTTKDLQE